MDGEYVMGHCIRLIGWGVEKKVITFFGTCFIYEIANARYLSETYLTKSRYAECFQSLEIWQMAHQNPLKKISV